MKPKPTEYNGVIYRSRLEARWAIFFDWMEMIVAYEPVTLATEFGNYTPDFCFLCGSAVEIKPEWPTGLEVEKMRAIADRRDGVLSLVGPPDFKPYWFVTKDNEWPIALIHSDFSHRAPDFLFDRNTNHRHSFPQNYRDAVDAANSAKFDGFDADREKIKRRYA